MSLGLLRGAGSSLEVRASRSRAMVPGALQATSDPVTGAWPFVADRSFELITGSKCEPWLARVIAAWVRVGPAGR